MRLMLEGIQQQAGSQVLLYSPIESLAPEPGAMTVLLGVTQAGKTSLMRIMAETGPPQPGEAVRARRARTSTRVPVKQRAERRHGVPAVHQLPLDDRLRQYRLAAAAAPGAGRG